MILKKIDDFSLNILLVEDDPVSNFLVTLKLKKRGFTNIASQENGLLALSHVKKNNIDLIFLDINMPVMDGFEFLEEFTRENIGPDTKVVMLTSSTRSCDQEAAAKYDNVVDFLEKPLTEANIENVFNKLNCAII